MLIRNAKINIAIQVDTEGMGDIPQDGYEEALKAELRENFPNVNEINIRFGASERERIKVEFAEQPEGLLEHEVAQLAEIAEREIEDIEETTFANLCKRL